MTTDSIASSDVQTRPLEHKYIAEHIASTKLKNQSFNRDRLTLRSLNDNLSRLEFFIVFDVFFS